MTGVPRTPAEHPPRARALIRGALAALLGVAAAVLVSCGSSGKGLIPSANSEPLQNDFAEVSQDAQTANGNCAATEAAIAKTESDFRALPGGIDGGLRTTLHQGIENLRTRALALCAQPASSTATTNTTKTATTPTTTPTTTTPTTTTPTTTTPTTTTPTTTPSTTPTTPPSGAGGGAQAPPETPGGPGEGNDNGAGNGGVPPGQEGK